ncbi:MAG: 5'-methylthioadenosine/adenosylhomocysteine nucleosidase [Bacteroidia bacterium]|nr:5'-methylthioadenosine/adenosylhomocysteine nucleosidase [Bacteroidia bacterium]
MKIGIMGAMPQEIHSILKIVEEKEHKEVAMREFVTGKIEGIEVVVVFSRIGKVAAASTVSILILEFGVSHVIFTGVAGAIAPGLKIGDIVVGENLIQHDMDPRPIMPQYEIPLLEKTYFETDPVLSRMAAHAAKEFFLDHDVFPYLKTIGSDDPKVMMGDIATGDKFFSFQKDKDALLGALPSIKCVEMEGAAVAQVCFEFGVPFTVIRTISDTADHNAGMDFLKFIDEILVELSPEVIKGILSRMRKSLIEN